MLSGCFLEVVRGLTQQCAALGEAFLVVHVCLPIDCCMCFLGHHAWDDLATTLILPGTAVWPARLRSQTRLACALACMLWSDVACILTHHVHDMTSCVAGRHGPKTLCQPRLGDFSQRTDRLVHSRPLFLHISGSSGVLEGYLLERNGHLPCNPQKKKKKSQN